MMITSLKMPGSRLLNKKASNAFPVRKHYLMRSDVRETDKMYYLDIDLPGFEKNEIRATVDDGYLCVEASKNIEKKNDKNNYVCRERYDGVYKRTFFVGTDVTQKDIKATYKHGVLRLSIPKEVKKPESKSESIQIA